MSQIDTNECRVTRKFFVIDFESHWYHFYLTPLNISLSFFAIHLFFRLLWHFLLSMEIEKLALMYLLSGSDLHTFIERDIMSTITLNIRNWMNGPFFSPLRYPTEHGTRSDAGSSANQMASHFKTLRGSHRRSRSWTVAGRHHPHRWRLRLLLSLRWYVIISLPVDLTVELPTLLLLLLLLLHLVRY